MTVCIGDVNKSNRLAKVKALKPRVAAIIRCSPGVSRLILSMTVVGSKSCALCCDCSYLVSLLASISAGISVILMDAYIVTISCWLDDFSGF